MRHEGHVLLITLSLWLDLAVGSYLPGWRLPRWSSGGTAETEPADDNRAPMVSVPVRVGGVDGELAEFESLARTETEASSFELETTGTRSTSDDNTAGILGHGDI